MSTYVDDLAVLELANRFYRRPGARDQAAHRELGLSPTGYARRLLAIIEDPSVEAVAAYGPLIVRLRRTVAVGRGRRAPARRVA